jgi:hypothetical protein
MKISNYRTGALFVLLIALDVAMRLTRHLPNCTPLAASALFASFLFESGILAMLVPLLAMVASDLVIGTYDWRIMGIVYLSLMFPVLLRRYLRGHLSVVRVAASALLSSGVFFFTTNFAVWYFARWYTPDIRGLLLCYAAAVPFLKNTVAGDLLWSGVFFGSYVMIAHLHSHEWFRFRSPRLHSN